MSAAMTITNDGAPEVLIDEPMARHTS